MKLLLDRSLIFFDLETTGINPHTDRIVSIGAVKFFPDGTSIEKEQLINPLVPIPPVATAVHGITDEAVANKPVFRSLSKSMQAFFSNCDLAGFNVFKFDLPLLQAEFERAGIAHFPEPSTKVIDVQVIYHSRERRTLTDAVRFYCQEQLVDSHDALSDVKATIRVLQRQLRVYDDLPITVDGLHQCCMLGKRSADFYGYLAYNEAGEVCFDRGKYRDRPVVEISQRDPSYVEWLIRKSNYPADSKVILKKLVYQSA